MQQLMDQLELCQNRMEHICHTQTDLDIRAQFGRIFFYGLDSERTESA